MSFGHVCSKKCATIANAKTIACLKKAGFKVIQCEDEKDDELSVLKTMWGYDEDDELTEEEIQELYKRG